MTRPTAALLGLLALAVVFGGWRHRDASYARAESRTLRVALDSLAKVKARTETTYVRTVDTLTRRIVRHDTLRAEVLRHITDTVLVREFVAASDSVVRACQSVVLTCEARVATRDAVIATLERKAEADAAVWRAQIPTRLDRLRSAALYVGVGYLAGKLTP